MANDDVNELLELADAWKRGVRSGGRSTGKLIDQLAAALREARTDKKYWERVANCLLSTCTDAQSDAAIGAAIEQGAIDAAMKPPGGEGSEHE